MRFLVVATAMLLAGCGGQGGTTGQNFSSPPPTAEIVATPTPTPTPTAAAAQPADPSNGDGDAAAAAADAVTNAAN